MQLDSCPSFIGNPAQPGYSNTDPFALCFLTMRSLVAKVLENQHAAMRADRTLAEDSYHGTKETALRIIEFAVSISRGDTTKSSRLKDAIESGFALAAIAFGGSLPEVSIQTYQTTMQKLDAWTKDCA